MAPLDPHFLFLSAPTEISSRARRRASSTHSFPELRRRKFAGDIDRWRIAAPVSPLDAAAEAGCRKARCRRAEGRKAGRELVECKGQRRGRGLKSRKEAQKCFLKSVNKSLEKEVVRKRCLNIFLQWKSVTT